MSAPVDLARAERWFAVLLALFPARFRARFGDDMRELFRDQLRAAAAQGGRRAVARLWARTLPSLARSALLERLDPANRAPRRRSDRMLDTLASDARFAGRMLRKSPAFTLVAVLVIALGTGAVTTIFSAMNALLLRPLPGTTDGGRLVELELTRRNADGQRSTSSRAYDAMRAHVRTLDGLVAWSNLPLSISSQGEGVAAYGNIVSGNYFDVLGVRPERGRFFAPDEDRTPLTHPVIVLSHAMWTRLGADPALVGRVVRVNGHPYTVIGVAPAAFRGVITVIAPDAWVPLQMQPQLRPGHGADDGSWLRTFGRLRPGVARGTAQAELSTLAAAYAQDAPGTDAGHPITGVRLSALRGIPDNARGMFLGFLALLLGAAGLVLLIASVNVASMLSARAIARRREMALRSALGAGRGRLVRQLLTETLALFTAGALGGLAIAAVATGAVARIHVPVDVSLSIEISPDLRAFCFALGVSLLTGVAFGLAPALQAAGRDVNGRLREGTHGSGTRRTPFGNALIIGQLAASLVLLVSAGLFIRALDHGARVDPGFEIGGVATTSLNTESWGYDAARGTAFYRELRERVAALPGVTAVSYSEFVPLAMQSSGNVVQVDDAPGATDGRAVDVPAQMMNVDADYFTVVRIPIVRGRAIALRDDERAPRVAVVNETFARRLWPDGSAVGRTFRSGGDRVTIVGIARDAKYASLTEETPAFAYFPLAQRPQPAHVLLVRTDGDPERLAPALQRTVLAIDAALPRPTVTTLHDLTRIVLLPQRIAAGVTGVLGGIGLLLATVGLYGVMAYATTRRTREIGIRTALGARRSDVLALIVREGMRLAGMGVAIGLVLAAAAARLLSGLLFGISPLDGLAFAGTSLLLVGVAIVASWLPARRAAATSPTVALRAD